MLRSLQLDDIVVDAAPATRQPIFVVGSAKSDTTWLRLTLDSHPLISCSPDTHFLSDLVKVTGRNSAHLAHYGYPQQYWLSSIARFFGAIQSDYAESRGKVRWAYATDAAALSVERIDQLFPRSQVVHVVRERHVGVAGSRKRLSSMAFGTAGATRQRSVRTTRSAGSRMLPGRYHEVCLEDLRADPSGTMGALLTFLGEDWNDALMQGWKGPG